MNENIRGLFAFTPQSKAQLHVELAMRRLEEVQDLAAAGKLDDGAKADVEQKLDQHIADLKSSLIELEQQNPSATTTASTTDSTASSTDVTATSTDDTASSTADSVKKISTLSAIASDDATTTATSTLESKIKDASADLKEGGNKVGTEDYGEAYALVKKAEQTTKEIKALINDLPSSDKSDDTKDKDADQSATTTSAISTSTQTAAVIDAVATSTPGATSSVSE